MVGYGNDDRYDSRDRYDDDDDQMSYPGGRDPRRYGQDMADKKPIYTDADSMEELLYIWILNVDNWEQKGTSKYRGSSRGNYGNDKYQKNKYPKDKDYKGKDKYDNDDKRKDKYGNDDKRKDKYGNDDDDYEKKGDYRKKRSYKKVTFPVRHYKDVERFPIRKLNVFFLRHLSISDGLFRTISTPFCNVTMVTNFL